MQSQTIPKLMKTLKRLEPLIAVLILITLVILCVNLLKYNKLQEEINVNCGWEEEHGDYKCFYQCSQHAYMNYVEYVDNMDKPTDLKLKDLEAWD